MNTDIPVIGTSGTPAPLVFTDAAAQKVSQLIEEESNPALMLRVFISGGGCSGFQYEIDLDDIKADDLIISGHGESVVIDSISLPFLSSAVIDFSEELIGARFVIENPNASSSCGCGVSFSL